MKAIFGRLRRLENAVAPLERERADVAAILESMRRSGDDDSPTFSPESYEGCHTCADFILRECALLYEHESQHPKLQGQNK